MLGAISSHYVASGGGGGGSGYSAAVLADSPLAYWRLGESSGTTMVDSSGNGRDGTYAGGYTLGATGLLTGDADTCVDFTNGEGRVADAAWMDVTSITVDCVVNLDAVNEEMLVERDSQGVGSDSRVFQFRVANGFLEFIYFTQSWGSNLARGSTTLQAGITYHLAATYDGTTARVYVDGVQDGTHDRVDTLNTGTRFINVGRSGYADIWPSDGRIDEVAYYGTALSAARIAAHAAAV